MKKKISDLNLVIKVSKSPKHFFLKLHCLKNEPKNDKRQNSALLSKDRICQIYIVLFGGNECQENAFEIY